MENMSVVSDGTLGSVLLAVVIYAMLYLIATNKTRKVSAKQAVLDKKTGASTPPKQDDQDEKREYTIKYFWSILLVLAGGVLVYWGLDTQVRPVDVGSWSADKWFPLLVLWGVLAGLIALNAKALGATAKTLQWVVMGAMLALLIAFPLWSWVVGEEKPVPLTLTAPASGDSQHIKAPPGYAVIFLGGEGSFDAYYGYADGVEVNTREEMPSDKRGVEIMYSYVRDKSGKENTVTYEFSRPN